MADEDKVKDCKKRQFAKLFILKRKCFKGEVSKIDGTCSTCMVNEYWGFDKN